MRNHIRVLIVDDHEILRQGLDLLISRESDIEVVGHASDGAEALSLGKSLQPDVVLMDLALPGMSGIQAMQQLRKISPSSHFLVLSGFTDHRHVNEAIRAGAIGYLAKNVVRHDLIHAIREVAQGNPTLHPEAQRHLVQQVATPTRSSPLQQLTPREHEVLQLIAQGNNNKQISASLHLTQGTIKGYVSAILDKLCVTDRTQAALYAVRHGVVSNT